MEKLIYTNGQYNIWQLTGKECLQELAEFVVRENYKHHVGDFSYEFIKDEIDSVYQEELQYNEAGKIIGSIRVFKWDRKKILPLQKVFGINPLMTIHSESDYSYWHIGRFAVDSFAGIPTITCLSNLWYMRCILLFAMKKVI